jgi:hypothetical protein
MSSPVIFGNNTVKTTLFTLPPPFAADQRLCRFHYIERQKIAAVDLKNT